MVYKVKQGDKDKCKYCGGEVWYGGVMWRTKAKKDYSIICRGTPNPSYFHEPVKYYETPEGYERELNFKKYYEAGNKI